MRLQGLVKKEPHASDARWIILKTTDKARVLHPKIQNAVLELEDSIEAQVGARNLQEFVHHLSSFLELEF